MRHQPGDPDHLPNSSSAVKSIDLVRQGRAYLLLAIFDGNVHQLGILWFLRCGQNQGRIGGGILRLVFPDGLVVLSACTASWIAMVAHSRSRPSRILPSVRNLISAGFQFAIDRVFSQCQTASAVPVSLPSWPVRVRLRSGRGGGAVKSACSRANDNVADEIECFSHQS